MYKSLRSFVLCSVISRLQKRALAVAVQTETRWRQGQAVPPPPVLGDTEGMQWPPPPKSQKGETNGKVETHPPWSQHPGEGRRRGTQLCKHSQGSSTDPDLGSPQGSTPTGQRQKDRVSELISITCDWLYRLIWPQPHFASLLCGGGVPERRELLGFPHPHARTKASHAVTPPLQIFLLASNSSSRNGNV